MKLLLAATLTFTLCAPLAVAAESSISITPAVIMLRGALGEGATQPISVVNHTDHELRFEMVAFDVDIRDGKRTFVPAGEMVGSIAATAVFSRPTVRLAPDEAGTVSVTLTLPPNAVHRAAVIVFSAKTALRTEEATILASVGTLVTFQVSNQVVVDVAAPVIMPQTASQNVRVMQRAMNKGAEPTMLKGTAAVLDAAGNLAGRVDLEPQRLLPGEGVELTGELAEELPRGHYRVLVTVQTDAKTTTTDGPLEIQ